MGAVWKDLLIVALAAAIAVAANYYFFGDQAAKTSKRSDPSHSEEREKDTRPPALP